MVDQEVIKSVKNLRHKLHMYPELSNCEGETKATLMKFLTENTSLEITDCGRWFYCKYTALNALKEPIAFRADMDAIKVLEDDTLPYGSKNKGVSHKCGHDGHSSALCALGLHIDKNGADRDVYLIFQHAEEVGSGAEECCEIIEKEHIAEIYGIHNFPGMPFGSVCTRAGTVNLASVGIEYIFTGAPTHASTPELGKNPAKAISKMVLAIDEITEAIEPKGLLLATVIQVDIGEEAFGVAASNGKLLLTVRGEFENEMNLFIDRLNAAAYGYCEEDGISINIEYHERFVETSNSKEAIDKIKNVCSENDIEYCELKEPIRTSEDFGHYTKKTEGALIWLGAGKEWPPLHSTEFDYNDDLIERSCELFYKLISC